MRHPLVQTWCNAICWQPSSGNSAGYWQVAIETLHDLFTPQALPFWQSVLLLQPHDAPPTQTGPGLHDTVQSEQ